MTLLEAALLGVVQGLTEFLPVSSSAHLILAREFFGWSPGAGEHAAALTLAFDVACHVGTLAAVLVFFRADVVALAAAIPDALRGRTGPQVRRLWLIAAGTVPIVIVGLLFADVVESRLRTPFVAATALLVGAVFLIVIERIGSQGHSEERLTMGGAFGVGVAQALALVPGVSRSGATIATGMALGLRREAAARFAFLMSVPAILAAAAKEAIELPGLGLGADAAAVMLVGLVTSAVVGYVTVALFIRYLARHRLDVFAWYRAGLAVVTFAWLAR